MEITTDLSSLIIADRVLSSGQLLNVVAALTYTYTVTVVEGAYYEVHADNGTIYLGMAAGDTQANVIWTVGAGGDKIIHIPTGGGTELYYFGKSAGILGTIARIV